MAGIGKLAIAVVLIGVLAFALISSASMMKSGQTTDPICTAGTLCNGTVSMSEMGSTQGVNLMVPVFVITAVMLLLATLTFLRRSSR